MKRLAYILMAAAVVFAACAKEEFEHPAETGIVNAASFNPTVTVDQETNQVTFTLGEKGVIPVWVLQDNTGEWASYNARDGFKKIFASAGDFAVRMYVMNASGMSPDYVEKAFHIDNTIMNFDKYIRYIAGKDSKVWRIDNSAEAHQACGPNVGNPTEWWSAKPDEKADFGIYDNRLTFSADGNYTFDPGDSGTVYVNTGVTAAPYGEFRQDADYTVAVSAETSPYEFAVDGNDLLLKLKDGALFPYIPNNDYLNDSKFYVISLDNNAATLVWYTPTGNGGGSIAWQFLLTSKAGETKFNGFKYNAESNMWRPADEAHTYSQYYAPGWAQLPDVDVVQEGSSYTLNYPSATSDQWQAQFFIIPDEPISLSAEKHYDFSVIINVSNTVPGMTFKLTDASDDGNFLFTERVEVPAGDDYIFYRSDLEGIDAEAVKMVFDFGGNADNTEVVIKNIVLKDHAIDDGTVLPGDEPGPEPPAGYTYGPDVLEGLFLQETWFSPADWSGGLDPQASYEGGTLTLTVPDGTGGNEWQGQVKLVASVPADPAKEYAFFANIEASEGGTATVKVADANDDSNHAFFYDNNVVLGDSTPLAYKNEPVKPDQAYEAIMVIFDFGRIPAGSEIKVTGIKLCEITGSSGGQEDGYTYGPNLWTGAEELETWFSPADWSGGLDPQASYEGGVLKLTVPDGVGGAEWQGQVKLHSAIPIDPAKEYGFSAKILADDSSTATVKLTSNTDPGGVEFFYDNGVALESDTPLAYKREAVSMDNGEGETVMLVLDFGRFPAGTEITVSDFFFAEVTGKGGGTTPPDGPVDPVEPAEPEIDESGTNLWPGAGITLETWFSPADWSGGLAPQVIFPLDANGIVIVVPEGIGGGEWQGQVKLHTNIPAVSPVNLAARIASTRTGACTVKLTTNSDPEGASYLYDNNVALKANKTVVLQQKGLSMDAAEGETMMLIFDLGRMQAGTVVTITDIGIRVQEAPAEGPVYNADTNLWKKVDDAGAQYFFYYLNPGWAGEIYGETEGESVPFLTVDGSKYTLNLAEATDGRWQRQFFIHPKSGSEVALSAGKKYNVQFTVNSSAAFTAFFKISVAKPDGAPKYEGDTISELGEFDIPAGESKKISIMGFDGVDTDNVLLVWDFGGNPEGTTLVISDIIIEEA